MVGELKIIKPYALSICGLCSALHHLVQGSVVWILCSALLIAQAKPLPAEAVEQQVVQVVKSQGSVEENISNLLKEIQSLKTDLLTLKARIEEQRAISKIVSDLLIEVQSLRREFQNSTGRFEETQHLSEKTSKELTDSRNALTAQMKKLETTVNALQEKLSRIESAATAPATPQQPVKGVKPEKSAEENISRALSNLSTQVQSFKTELQGVTERFEQTQHLSEKTSKELTDSRNALSAQMKKLETTVNALQEKLSRIESAATVPAAPQQPVKGVKPEKSAEENISRALSNLSMEVQSFKTELQGVTERFEETQHLSEKTSKELTDSRNALSAEIKRLETANAKSTPELQLSIQRLNAKLQDLTAGLEEQKVSSETVSALRTQVQTLKDTFGATSKATSDLLLQVQALKTNLKDLSGELEEQKASSRRVSELQTEIRSLREGQGATGRATSDLLLQVQGLKTEFQNLSGRLEEQKAISKSASDTLLMETQSLEIELEGIKERFEGVQKIASDLSAHVPLLKTELRSLTVRLEEQKVSGKSASDLLLEVQSLRRELQSLTGRFEQTQHLSEKTSKELTKELTDSRNALATQVKGLKELEAHINTLQKKLSAVELTATTAAQQLAQVIKQMSADEDKQESRPPKKEAKDLYMEAQKAFEEEKLNEARKQFQSLLTDYPENEYSDDARFWIGEAYYKQKNYSSAILAYEELFKKNPDSDNVPDALLKQALSFYELKEDSIGRITLKKLINKFPNSEQAKIAREKLNLSAQSQDEPIPKNVGNKPIEK